MSIPIAAAAVVGGLILIQGSGGPARTSASSTAPAVPEPLSKPSASQPASPASGTASASASLLHGNGFALALPSGWKRTAPPRGAAFAAATRDQSANATLWIQRKPSLSLSAFEAQSLAQLRAAVGTAGEISNTPGATADSSVIRIGATPAPNKPSLEVTLRAAGPNRYFLETALQPNASSQAVQGVSLIQNSFVPEPSGKSGK